MGNLKTEKSNIMKYQVTQSFHTENHIEENHSLRQNFEKKEEAVQYFDEIKINQQQGGGIETVLWEYNGESDEYEDIDTHYNSFDYSKFYDKLVIGYQHTGKGMGYSHKFVDAFFLDKYNEKHISDNPDHRFTTWHEITDITIDDLNGLSYDEAVDLVESQLPYLRLENSINLERLGIVFKPEYEDENIY